MPMTTEQEKKTLIPNTEQEKIDTIQELLKSNVSPGEITWAKLRQKCGYEAIWGYSDNQREREKFKEFICQLADIEEISNTKCMVKEIYSTPCEIATKNIDLRIAGNHTGKGFWQILTKYALMKLLDNQIDHSMPPDTKQTIYLTDSYLSKVVGLVNPNYKNKTAERLFLKENPTIKMNDIQSMYNHCYPIITQVIRSGLNYLQRNYGGITWRDTYCFCKNSDVSFNCAGVSSNYYADQKDIHRIDAVFKRIVLDEMGLTSQRFVYLHNKQDAFYDRVLSLYNEENGTAYTEWYRTIEICVTPSQFYSAFDAFETELISYSRLDMEKRKCNERFIQRLENSTKKSYTSASNKLERYITSLSQDILDFIDMGFYTMEELIQAAHLYRYDDEYLAKQEKCRNNFIALS